MIDLSALRAPVRRLLVACIAILAVALLLGTPAAARADETGSLTIAKTAGEGDTPGQPLEGIEFEVRAVLDLPLQDAAALAELARLEPELLGDGGGHRLGEPIVLVTDSSGLATAGGLADGIYLVRERPSRVGDVAYSVIAPFLVAIGQNGERDVTVHAKNQELALGIVGSAEAARPGDPFSATLTGSVPAPDRHGRLHRYALLVRLDGAFADARIGRIWIEHGGEASELAIGRDAVVTWDESGRFARIELTPEGLARLAAIRAAHPDAVVRAQVDAALRADASPGSRPGIDAILFADGWPIPERWTSPDTWTDPHRLGVPSQLASVLVLPQTGPSGPDALSPPDGEAPAMNGEPGDPTGDSSLARSGAEAQLAPLWAGLGLLAAGCLLATLTRRRREPEPDDRTTIRITTAGGER